MERSKWHRQIYLSKKNIKLNYFFTNNNKGGVTKQFLGDIWAEN